MRSALKFFLRPYRWSDWEKQHPFEALSNRFARSEDCVRGFYIFSLILAYNLLTQIKNLASSADGVWLWPVYWLYWFDPFFGPVVLSTLLFAVSLYALVAYPYLHARLLLAVLIFLVAAVSNSYGAVNHGYHIWLWASVIFVFLPTGGLGPHAFRLRRAEKLSSLAVVAGIQAYILLSYTLAGLHKVRGGLIVLTNGGEGNFSTNGFAHQIADRMLQTDGEPFLASMVVENPVVFAPLFWLLIAIQTFAIAFLFLPKFHRLLGLLLIIFHFGTWALMDIAFYTHVLWQALFFVWSPFRPIYQRQMRQALLQRLLAM